jgi:hypothetical protein
MRMKLFFRHQQDGRWAALVESVGKSKKNLVVFPKGFTSQQGVRYEVEVYERERETHFFNNMLYYACDAVPLSQPVEGESSMAVALRDAGLAPDTIMGAAIRKARQQKSR